MASTAQQQQHPINEYEAQRAARIAANKARMESLGVVEAAQQLQLHKRPQQKQAKWRPGNKPRAAAAAAVSDPVVTRASKRLRGPPAEGAAAAAKKAQDDVSQQDQQLTTSSSNKTASKGSRDPNEPRFAITATQYAAPFTLMSIGVTVLDLGSIFRGPFSINYYSSRGCLFRHAYPVGYRASKEAFGHTWDMEISAGQAGPIFTVSQRGGRHSFSGTSPTRPWTDVCIAFRTGQRISGPLYFGFSDIHVQRALAAMYNPAELAYALYGTPLSGLAAAAAVPAALAPQPPPQTQTQQGDSEATAAAGASDETGVQPQQPAEQQEQQQELLAAEAFAAELQGIRGIGAATAQVLALTTALGGARHSSLQSLRAWLCADTKHPTRLQHYLLTSDEVPRCSRQLPSWREKWVPMIMQQLMQQQHQA